MAHLIWPDIFGCPIHLPTLSQSRDSNAALRDLERPTLFGQKFLGAVLTAIGFEPRTTPNTQTDLQKLTEETKVHREGWHGMLPSLTLGSATRRPSHLCALCGQITGSSALFPALDFLGVRQSICGMKRLQAQISTGLDALLTAILGRAFISSRRDKKENYDLPAESS